MGQRVRGRRLALAILLGLVLQYVMLLFSLHASLLFSDLCRGSSTCYWLLTDLYMGAGLALALMLVPWSRWPLRIGVGAGILAAMGVVYVVFPP